MIHCGYIIVGNIIGLAAFPSNSKGEVLDFQVGWCLVSSDSQCSHGFKKEVKKKKNGFCDSNLNKIRRYP